MEMNPSLLFSLPAAAAVDDVDVAVLALLFSDGIRGENSGFGGFLRERLGCCLNDPSRVTPLPPGLENCPHPPIDGDTPLFTLGLLSLLLLPLLLLLSIEL